MSPRTFVTRGASLLAIAAFGLAACESKTVVQPNVFPLQITVSPSSATLTAAGQKVQFVALVSGGETGQATQGVNWNSSNTAVATVDANGIVTAVANGTASIIATSKAVGSVQAAGIVTVNISSGPVVTPPANPTVSIQSITDNAGNNVDINNVKGQINVALNVDVPTGNTISSVNVLVDGAIACSQSFTQGAQAGVGTEAANAVTIVCPINTTKVGTNGVPVYANGPHTITATLVAPGGTVKASTSQSLVFTNVDVVNAAITTTKGPQTSNLGASWVGGDLTVTATPAIFSGSASNVARMTVSVTPFNSGTTITRTDTLASDGLTVTFPQSEDFSTSKNGLKGVQDSVKISITTVTTSGQQGPSYSNFTVLGAPVPPVLRIDNAAPTVTAFVVPTGAAPFINGSFAFGSTSSPTNFTTADNANGVNGVDRVTVVFQAAPASDTSVWKTVTTGADLAEVATPFYIVKAIVTDALGNAATFYGNNLGATFTAANATKFAVDLTVPTQSIDTAGTTMTPTSTANAFRSQTTAGNTVNISFGDAGLAPSGPKGIRFKIIQYTASGTTCLTKASNGSCVFSNTTGNSVTSGATTTTSAIPVPAGEAYDSIYVQTVDNAGNVSATIGMLVLQDNTVPSVGGITGPSVIAGGSSVGFSTQVSDNLDLRSASANEVFGLGALTIFAGSSTLGTFGLPLETAASPTVTLNPFLTSIEFASALGSSQDASAINMTITDQARKSTSQTLNVGPNIVTQATFTFTKSIATGGFGVAGTNIATNRLDICNGSDPTGTGLVCGTVPTNATITYAVSGPSGTFGNPFSRVDFYGDDGSGVYTLLGSASGASATDNGATRVWSYTFVWTPAGATATTWTIRAIGQDTKGHGLVSNGLSVNVHDAAQ